MLIQNRPAPLVHHPRRRTHLGVFIRRDVIHQEIDKPPLLLQRRQQADNLGLRTGRSLHRRRCRLGRFRHGSSSGSGGLRATGQRQHEQDKRGARSSAHKIRRVRPERRNQRQPGQHQDKQRQNKGDRLHIGCRPALTASRQVKCAAPVPHNPRFSKQVLDRSALPRSGDF
jgi:hypothetical protein